MTSRIRPRNHVRLIAMSMSHDILLDIQRPDKNDLSSRRVRPLILYTFQCPGCVTDAVEDDFCS